MADIEKFVTGDGRRAEKHINLDENGNKVISFFAEEERPLKLEKRVKQVFKPMLVEEHVETIKDGQVIDMKVSSTEPKTNLELREHIAVADKSIIGSDKYVSKEEVAELVAQGVVAGLNASKGMKMSQAIQPENPFRVQNAVEQRVEDTTKTVKMSDVAMYTVLGVAIIAQVAFGVYWFWFN